MVRQNKALFFRDCKTDLANKTDAKEISEIREINKISEISEIS